MTMKREGMQQVRGLREFRWARFGAALALLLALGTGAWAEPTTTATQGATPQAKRPAPSKKLAMSTAVGEEAPNFKAITFDGDQVELKQYRGKYVLLTFWASWCGFCVTDAPALKALHEEFVKDKRLVMISLSLDNNMEKAEEFVTKNKMDWTQGFLGDWKTDKVSQKYNMTDIPMMFLIGPDGKVIDKDVNAKWLRASLAKALGKNGKEKSAVDPAKVAPIPMPEQALAHQRDVMARRNAALQAARERAADKNTSAQAAETPIPLNEDPNDPNISNEERLARQRAIIMKRIEARQKDPKYKAMEMQQKAQQLEQLEKKAHE